MVPHSHNKICSQGPDPCHNLKGGNLWDLGMGKTRSRTLAEARKVKAAPMGGLGSPPASTSSATALPSSPSLDPASTLTPMSNLYPHHGPSNKALPRLSHPSPSETNLPIVLPDGWEASTGLDVALDFIGCQPQGFATPKKVRVFLTALSFIPFSFSVVLLLVCF